MSDMYDSLDVSDYYADKHNREEKENRNARKNHRSQKTRIRALLCDEPRVEESRETHAGEPV